jgi:hypothetical protein
MKTNMILSWVFCLLMVSTIGQAQNLSGFSKTANLKTTSKSLDNSSSYQSQKINQEIHPNGFLNPPSCMVTHQILGYTNFDDGIGNQTLEASTAGGIFNINPQSNSGTTYFPNNVPLYTSSPNSWLTSGQTKTLFFSYLNAEDELDDFDISHAENVKVSFNLAAFATSIGGGVNSSDYVVVFVSINGGTFLPEIYISSFLGSSVKFPYQNTATSQPISENYHGSGTAIEYFMNNAIQYNHVELNIPNNLNISSIEIAIQARTLSLNRFWLIDDVQITGDTDTKIWNGTLWLGDKIPPTTSQKAWLKGNFNTHTHDDLYGCALQLNNNYTLTINSETFADIESDVVNDGRIIVQSDGNFIQRNNISIYTPGANSSFIAQRFVQDMNNILYQTMDYVYWSSPVTGQAIHNGTNSIFSPGTPLNRNYQYKESNDYFVPTPDFTFKKGKGYAIRAEDGYPDGYDKTYQFTGIPNNGQIISEETLKYTDADHGYNLIGNPYPSNMDFEQFYYDNENFIEPVAYFWTNNVPEVYQYGSSYNGASYAIYNLTGGNPATTSADEGDGDFNILDEPNGIIKVGQGFIVKAKSAGLNQSLVFNNHQRLADNGIFFQRNTTDRFWLTLTSPQGIINTILIGFNENAVDEYDYGYDAPLLSLYSDAIYSIVDNERLAINGLKAPFHVDDVIPIGINPFSQGRYFINLGKLEGIFEEQQIFLKDKALNILHNLSDSPYEFRTTPGQHNHRFEIVFRKRPSLHSASQGLAHKTDLTILKKDKSIFIESPLEEIREVEIFDLFGKSLYKKGNIQGRTYSIPQSLFFHQILIVSVKTESGQIESKKLILK